MQIKYLRSIDKYMISVIKIHFIMRCEATFKYFRSKAKKPYNNTGMFLSSSITARINSQYWVAHKKIE